MSLTPAALRKLQEFGLSLEQVCELAELLPEKTTSKGAERQRRYRERKRSDVTGDVTSDASHVTPFPEPKSTPEPPKKTQPLTAPLPPLKGVVSPHGQSRKPSEPEGFAEFWAEYPRKVGKPNALKAYAKAVREIPGPDPPSQILTGLRAQLPGWALREPDHVPHPTTWLNREGWNDQPDSTGPRVIRNGQRPHHNDAAGRSEDRMRRILAGSEVAIAARRHGFGD